MKCETPGVDKNKTTKLMRESAISDNGMQLVMARISGLSTEIGYLPVIFSSEFDELNLNYLRRRIHFFFPVGAYIVWWSWGPELSPAFPGFPASMPYTVGAKINRKAN